MRNTKRTGIAYRGVCDGEKWNECLRKENHCFRAIRARPWHWRRLRLGWAIIKPDLLCAPKVLYFTISHRRLLLLLSLLDSYLFIIIFFSVLIRSRRFYLFLFCDNGIKYVWSFVRLFCENILMSFCYSNDDVAGSDGDCRAKSISTEVYNIFHALSTFISSIFAFIWLWSA